MSYKFSTDYESLYEKVNNGMEVAAFVDFTRPEIHDLICRDVCAIKKRKDWDISIGVRGYSYGGVYYNNEDGRGEKEQFIDECKRLNLKWIPECN